MLFFLLLLVAPLVSLSILAYGLLPRVLYVGVVANPHTGEIFDQYVSTRTRTGALLYMLAWSKVHPTPVMVRTIRLYDPRTAWEEHYYTKVL